MDKKKQVKRLSARQGFIIHNYCSKMKCESCPLRSKEEDNTSCENTVLQDKILELGFGTKKQ